MEYYLTKMQYNMTLLGPCEVTQLVKASSPESARKAVEDAAIAEKGEEITILEIRVLETLIGV